MQCYWTVFTDTNTFDAARTVVDRLRVLSNAAFNEIEVEAYSKGGHKVRFSVDHGTLDWTQMVYDVILFSQRLGHRWSIAGGVEEELSLTSSHLTVSGIIMLTCWCSHLEHLGGG
ncbi:hypothetical protein Q31b_58200 [Novipirellula aureliae]|uniref:Uncharacterized protein n=1 Tax=Novipirellula aureliae TaxID=2527966 RepID=A0A5C6DAN4_9BACT|nr:hypothetical protein [Novipirellula aureliae]TWU32777.1 hypothetical protein Q31b_58200 [Novipirellula aureliae]